MENKLIICNFSLFLKFQKTQWENYDLTTVYKEYIKSINPQNLSLLIESYLA